MHVISYATPGIDGFESSANYIIRQNSAGEQAIPATSGKAISLRERPVSFRR